MRALDACVAAWRKSLPLSAAPPPSLPPPAFAGANGTVPGGRVEIPFVRDAAGGIELQVVVDGVPATFLLDSGSSGVSIPQEFFERLHREGRIEESDYRHRVDVVLANGQHEQMRLYALHSLVVGGRAVLEVEATVGRPGSGYLLGQDFLERFGSVSIDYVRGILRLGS
jgi:predicted aspartyl protease